MIWKKDIYDSLTSCAAVCDEFATVCSRSEDMESGYRSIFLSLDCSDLCRQLAMLYVRGSENTHLLAKACMEVCEKCAQEVTNTNIKQGERVYTMCQQVMVSCMSVLSMTQQSGDSNRPTKTPASLFYGIDLRETPCN